MIKVKQVTKAYEDIIAVKKMNLTIEDGQFFGLLGPNGAGKTTLIRMMTGLIDPTGGQVHIDDQLMDRDAITMKSMIGVVSQHVNLDKELTVRENLIFNGKLYGLSSKQVAEKTEELLDLMTLKKAENRVCKKLSGGMKRKLMIARALMHEPQYLFLDEPTVGVDATSRRDIWDILRKINQGGTTVLLTSHYIDEVAQLCDTVALLHEGQLLEIDAPASHIDRLGAVTVDFTEQGASTTCHFKSREDAMAFASQVQSDFSVRETTLEDVFFSITNRTVNDGK